MVVETSFNRPKKNILLGLTLKILFLWAVLCAIRPTSSMLCSPNFDLLRLNCSIVVRATQQYRIRTVISLHQAE